MGLGMVRADRKGEQFELALRAVRQIKKENFLLKADDEWTYANILGSKLQGSNKLRPHVNIHTQKDPEQKMIRVKAFAFDHLPDITIDNDGTAIEIKLIKVGGDLRDCLGQALIYRFAYRFVIMVLIDRTDNRAFVESLRKRTSSEAELLRGMADEFNIVTVAGPVDRFKNLAFVPKSSGRKPPAGPMPPMQPTFPQVPG
jgi:hypothetical protein